MKIAKKGARPVHEIVWNATWQIAEAACGASTHRYTITEGGKASDVTCKRCRARY